MYTNKCLLILGFVLTLELELISGKTNYSSIQTYPKSKGLSGGGFGSNGLSGMGQSPGKLSSSGHSYPSSVNSPSYTTPGYSSSYPKSGGVFGYPATTGSQRSPSYAGSYNYPSSTSSPGRYTPGNSPGYPQSTSNSGYANSGVNPNYPLSVGRQNASSQQHSYPSSGGSLNSSRHNYSLSGVNPASPSRGSQFYPSSTVNYGYPPSPGIHSYPVGNKLNSSSSRHSYPTSGNSNSYSPSGHPGSSGNTHAYPSSGGGLSGGGNRQSGYPPKTTLHHTTNVYKNYYYKPPAKIVYIPRHGSAAVNYPVYHGLPPNYVYQYKDSGSKYGTLLAGLALMNLGALGVSGYAAHQPGQNQGLNNYKPQPGEVCIFAIKKENGYYQETKIDCEIISSFILQEMQARNLGNNLPIPYNNTPNMATNQNITVPVQYPFIMLSNGTLLNVIDAYTMPLPNVTAPQAPGTLQYDMMPNGTLVSKGVLSGTTGGVRYMGEVKNALEVKGKPVEVTSKTECFLISYSPTWNIRKSVPCRLLQTYADSSLRRNSATCNIPMFTIIAAILVYIILY